jgi:micrococcal nuclease
MMATAMAEKTACERIRHPWLPRGLVGRFGLIVLIGALAVAVGAAAGLAACSDPAEATEDAGLPDAAPDAEAPGFPFPARVLRVVDGDTLEVEFLGRDLRVRLMGVNTPELGPPPEAYADEAHHFTIDHAPPTYTVGLEFDDDRCGEIPFPDPCFDIYDRLLAYIRTPEQQDLNALLLEAGLARVYDQTSFGRKTEYLQIQSQAQTDGVGIWGP